LKTQALLYHDVVEPGEPDSSGFPGADGAGYKLERAMFIAHLHALRDRLPGPPVAANRFDPTCSGRFILTFDDGGRSATTTIAPLLAELDWRAYFFVTTGMIGAPGFMSDEEIVALDQAGHIVGSHSVTHPTRMSACNDADLRDEWTRSRERLETILGHEVVVGSVPGGHYSDRVARIAHEAGIDVLFTSEPVVKHRMVGECRVIGRFDVQRTTPSSMAASLAAGALGPRARQLILWNAKKVAKRVGGPAYQKLRSSLLARRHPAGRGADEHPE